jgi:KDO2-lipid IV(A) lauroyltransferase
VALAACHLGAWEAVTRTLPRLAGRPVFYTWQPQGSRFHNRLLWRLRKAGGLVGLPPGQQSARLAYRLFVDGRERICLFVDEVVDGESRFPPFWRPMPERGNATVLLKLAYRTAAPVLPTWLVRTEGARFTLHIGEPLALDLRQPRDLFLRHGRRLLANRMEPVIRAHVDQWYMLAEMRQQPRQSDRDSPALRVTDPPAKSAAARRR